MGRCAGAAPRLGFAPRLVEALVNGRCGSWGRSEDAWRRTSAAPRRRFGVVQCAGRWSMPSPLCWRSASPWAWRQRSPKKASAIGQASKRSRSTSSNLSCAIQRRNANLGCQPHKTTPLPRQLPPRPSPPPLLPALRARQRRRTPNAMSIPMRQSPKETQRDSTSAISKTRTTSGRPSKKPARRAMSGSCWIPTRLSRASRFAIANAPWTREE